MQVISETGSRSFWSRRWLRGILLFAAWTLFGLFFVSQLLISRAYRGRALDLGHTLINWLTCAYLWAALTPLVLYLSRRFRIERGRLRNLPLHLLASLIASLVHLGAYIAVSSLIIPLTAPAVQVFKEFVFNGLHFNLITYWTVVVISHAVDYYRKYQERELSASRFKAQLVQAQLTALRSQLQPHFLFNTLNSIAVLMRKNSNEEAVDMLTGLADLLRVLFKNIEVQEVSLKEELEFLERYLEIEKVRFKDRLRVNMKIEPDTLEALVPNLILQPIVENAIRHGIEQRSASGLLEISAQRQNGTLSLEVRDDGPGLSPEDKPGEGQIGLANTRTRLRQLYGEAQSFELRNEVGGGAVATMAIPFRLPEEK